jgi:hypothetical protein
MITTIIAILFIMPMLLRRGPVNPLANIGEQEAE